MRAIPTLKISISGVRGVIGDSLTPTLLTRFAQAFGTYVGSGTVVVGRDTRTSGEMVRQAVVAGLLSSGCRVVDAGVCPVPTVQLAVRHRRALGGIAITASHNPAEWNALKFIGPDGLFLGAGPARELLDIYHQGEYVKVAGTEIRSVEQMTDALDLHFKAILDAVGPLPAGPRRLRVALDACNGAGVFIAPRLLEALGVDVVPINVTPNGLFPRPAEPIPENLGALCETVRAARLRHRLRAGHGRRPPRRRVRARSAHRRGLHPGAGHLVRARQAARARRGQPLDDGGPRRGGAAIQVPGPADEDRRGQRHRAHAERTRGDRGRRQRRRDLPRHQFRARQPGGHGPHPPPARFVGQDGVGPGRRVASVRDGEREAHLSVEQDP